MASANAKKLLPPEMYLQKHSLKTYVHDAVASVLHRKDENKPLDVLVDYFESVTSGTHVVFREYAYVAATLYNRVSFLKLFWRTYAQMALKGAAMNVRDYLSLLRLLCPDFPEELTDHLPQSARGDTMSFSDFIYAFEVILCYNHFLVRCLFRYVAIQDGRTLEELTEGREVWGYEHTDIPKGIKWPVVTIQHTMEASLFGKAVIDLASSHLMYKEICQCCPSMDTLEEVLSGCHQLTFDQFLLRLCASDRVRNEIGVLPPRSQFLSASIALQLDSKS